MTTTVPDAIPLLHALLAQPAERQRLITRYLRGEMEPSMLAAFEECLLDNAALLDDVETEKSLSQGLREAGAAAVLGNAAPAPPPRRRLPLTFAAGGLFGALLGATLLAPPAAQAPRAQTVAVAQLPVARGGSHPPPATLQLAAGGGPLVLRVPATNEPGPFRLRVRDAEGALLIELTDLTPDENGLLDLLLTLPAAARTDLGVEMDAWSEGAWRPRPAHRLRIARTLPQGT